MALRRGIIQNYYRGHRITTEPNAEPVTLSEIKDHLRIDSNDENNQINLLIGVARQYIEQVTGLAMITQTWTLTMDQWPNASDQWWDGVKQGPAYMINGGAYPTEVRLPRYPLQSIDSMTVGGDSVTVANVFTVDTQQFPGRIVLKTGASLPTYTETANNISIVYVAGFGNSHTDVPDVIRLAVMQMASSLYTHRGDECTMEHAYINSGAQSLIGSYKAGRF